MTREEYREFHEKFCRKMIEVTQKKNADYTGQTDKDDPFANFRMVEHLGLCKTETGMLTRMSDKLARIATWVKKGDLQVKDEGVFDTLLDLANYSALLSGVIAERLGPADHGNAVTVYDGTTMEKKP